MEREAGRLRRAPSERFAGSEHAYDLVVMAASLRAEPHPATDGHRQMTIARHGGTTLVLFDFEAAGRLADHVTDGLVTIHVLAGRIQVDTADGSHDLSAGSLLALSPGVRHDVHAIVASEVLLSVHRQEPAVSASS